MHCATTIHRRNIKAAEKQTGKEIDLENDDWPNPFKPKQEMGKLLPFPLHSSRKKLDKNPLDIPDDAA